MSKNRRRKPRGRHSSVRNVPLRTHWLLLSTLVLTLSAALLLRQGLGRDDQAAAVESAVDRALEKGVRTGDLGGNATTADMTRAVLEEL